jgi:hypothetical protein
MQAGPGRSTGRMSWYKSVRYQDWGNISLDREAMIAWAATLAEQPNKTFTNSPAKPPALPERIEAVLHFRE